MSVPASLTSSRHLSVSLSISTRLDPSRRSRSAHATWRGTVRWMPPKAAWCGSWCAWTPSPSVSTPTGSRAVSRHPQWSRASRSCDDSSTECRHASWHARTNYTYPACNHTCPDLQPYVPRPATTRARTCHHTSSGAARRGPCGLHQGHPAEAARRGDTARGPPRVRRQDRAAAGVHRA